MLDHRHNHLEYILVIVLTVALGVLQYFVKVLTCRDRFFLCLYLNCCLLVFIIIIIIILDVDAVTRFFLFFKLNQTIRLCYGLVFILFL